jgi:hypothetical protein
MPLWLARARPAFGTEAEDDHGLLVFRLNNGWSKYLQVDKGGAAARHKAGEF